jgi:hypothetical protein
MLAISASGLDSPSLVSIVFMKEFRHGAAGTDSLTEAKNGQINKGYIYQI